MEPDQHSLKTPQHREAHLVHFLHGTTNAAVWASEFVRMHGGDRGLMITWFANAIEVGRDAGR